MNIQWAKNFTGDVHIVYFENLVENVDGTLRGILEFLNFPLNEVNIWLKLSIQILSDRICIPFYLIRNSSHVLYHAKRVFIGERSVL